jgi:hypothetical protein
MNIINIIEKLGITPGTWKIEKTEETDNKLDLLIISGSHNIGWIYNDMEKESKLITTAPEMLLWIIGMIESADNNDMSKAGKLLLLGDELLKKATGKSLEEIKELK